MFKFLKACSAASSLASALYGALADPVTLPLTETQGLRWWSRTDKCSLTFHFCVPPTLGGCHWPIVSFGIADGPKLPYGLETCAG